MDNCETTDPLGKRVCFECVAETFLSDEIERDGFIGRCSYCDQKLPCITVEALADRVETVFADHFVRTSDQPESWEQSLLSDRESNYEWERAGQAVVDAIAEVTRIPYEAAQDVQAILDGRHDDFNAAAMGEETEFSADSRYEEKGPSTTAWHYAWRGFEESLKTEARFFSQSAQTHLATVFGRIDKLTTKKGRPLVVSAGPKGAIKALYRARTFQALDKLEEALCRPDLHLGSPPARLASGGRMNARGISVFYGATLARAAIAEVRPPVGSNVAVAKFAIVRPLRLLDLTAIADAWDGGSLFDPTVKDRMERVAFLRSLESRMVRPVMPDDEALDYLVTQAIADFLATQNEPRLDGILFPSVQSKGGRNVVLFHAAARVEPMKLPPGTKLHAHTGMGTEDGWETDYGVIERVPSQPSQPPESDDIDWAQVITVGDGRLHEDDGRQITLRVDPMTVSVHEVQWVNYRCTTFAVSRHRFESGNSDF